MTRTGSTLREMGDVIPTLTQLIGTEEKHLRLLESTAVDLRWVEGNTKHRDNPCHSPTCPRQGCKSPGMHASQELEDRDRRAIPGQGLLLAVGRWPKGT